MNGEKILYACLEVNSSLHFHFKYQKNGKIPSSENGSDSPELSGEQLLAMRDVLDLRRKTPFLKSLFLIQKLGNIPPFKGISSIFPIVILSSKTHHIGFSSMLSFEPILSPMIPPTQEASDRENNLEDIPVDHSFVILRSILLDDSLIRSVSKGTELEG